MNRGKLVFAQLMQHLPLTTFRRCVTRYRGAFKVKSFSCLDQFLCMAICDQSVVRPHDLKPEALLSEALIGRLYHTQMGRETSTSGNTRHSAIQVASKICL
jgi:hypothetical protein